MADDADRDVDPAGGREYDERVRCGLLFRAVAEDAADSDQLRSGSVHDCEQCECIVDSGAGVDEYTVNVRHRLLSRFLCAAASSTRRPGVGR